MPTPLPQPPAFQRNATVSHGEVVVSQRGRVLCNFPLGTQYCVSYNFYPRDELRHFRFRDVRLGKCIGGRNAHVLSLSPTNELGFGWRKACRQVCVEGGRMVGEGLIIYPIPALTWDAVSPPSPVRP